MWTEGPGGPDPRLLRRFSAWMEGRARLHDYRIFGLEHLPSGPALLVGYHGRPSLDAFLLGLHIYNSQGLLPRGIGHDKLFELGALGRLCRGLGMVPSGEVEALAQAGERVLVLPGGTREFLRPGSVRYRTDWGGRAGFARLAIRHRLPIVPFASTGVDELYTLIGLDVHASKRLFGSDVIPLMWGFGRGGMPWPAPEHRVRMRQWIGEPILPPAGIEAAPELASQVEDQVQALLDEAIAKLPGPEGGIRFHAFTG